MNHKEKTKNTYNKIAEEFNQRNAELFWVDQIKTFKNLVPHGKIIDIGCGTGRDGEEFVERYEYVGVDASEGMLTIAQKRVPKGTFKQMDFYTLEFPDNTFDGFWAAASLLHVPKKEINIVLQEIYRITKEKGVGFISIKEKTILEEGIIKEEKMGGIERYFSFYTQEEFKKILEVNNFTILEQGTHVENDERKTHWLYFFVQK